MTHDDEMELVRAIARLEEKVDTLDALKHRVRSLEAAENQRKGRWLTLSGLLALAGTIGGIVSSFFGNWYK